MATISVTPPGFALDTKQREIKIEQLDYKKTQIMNDPSIPEIRKKMMTQDIELAKKRLKMETKMKEFDLMKRMSE